VTMTKIASVRAQPVVIRRISEQVQSDQDLMLKLKRIGIQPGREVMVSASADGVRVTSEDRVGGTAAELPHSVAVHVFVTGS
jgi:DtxR family Mn-dependent transcriptional regulator